MTIKIDIDEHEYTSLFKCTRCGQCTYGKEEAEFTTLCPVNKMGHFFSYSAGGMMHIVRNVYEGKIDYTDTLKEIIFHCTTCGVCETNCGVIENHLEIIGRLRKELARMDFPEAKALTQVVASIGEHKNPYGREQASRNDWMTGLWGRKDDRDASVLYYAGCVSAYDQKTIPQALAGIWEKLGIPFTVSDEEWCCGGPLYYSGYKDEARQLARHNVKTIEDLGIKTVVASCPTCALVFKRYYPQLLKKELPFTVLHASEYLNQLVAEGTLVPGALKKKANLVYHDSCHLGRELKLFDEPRNLLKSIDGVRLSEFELNRENSQCCGGGGLVPMLFPKFSMQTANERLDQADPETIDTLASACPNCKKTLHLAARKNRLKMKIVDVCELIHESLA